MILAFLVLGPLMVPLVWAHPRYTIATKIVASVAVVGITVWGMIEIHGLYSRLWDKIEALGI